MQRAVKVDLDRIDRLRERVDLTYEEAASYLEAAGGDLVQALIMAERDMCGGKSARGAAGFVPDSDVVEEGQSSLGKLADGIKELWNHGASMRVVVERDGDKLANLPIVAGIIGAVVAPQLAAIGAMAALATGCTVRVETR